MSARVWRTSSEEETIALGEAIALELPRHAVVMLIGELGAGKTTLSKGIVRGLGAAELDQVSSPTFTLVHEYGVEPKVYHIDLYRLETEREVVGLGFEEILDRDAVILIEWGERFPALLPSDRIEISIQPQADDSRLVELTEFRG